MKVLAIWIIIAELPNINMIVTFTKRLQIQLRSVNHLVILWVSSFQALTKVKDTSFTSGHTSCSLVITITSAGRHMLKFLKKKNGPADCISVVSLYML